MKQKLILLEGIDRTGKTNIGDRLSRVLNIPIFKNQREREGCMGESPYDFPTAVKYEQPYMLQFLDQTKTSAIFDRGFLSEYAYGRAYGRENIDNLILELSARWGLMGGVIILFEKGEEALKEDWETEDLIEYSKAQEIIQYYKEAADKMKCRVITITTDDRDTDAQVKRIIDKLTAAGFFGFDQEDD